jgi:arylsulfatase A-like enzyme
MRRAIVVVTDGLRRDFVGPDWTPNLARFRESARFFAAHRSVTPSVTRVAASSFATGCVPAAHGLEGNSFALIEDGRFVVHDTGHPDFLRQRRRLTGRCLDRPTLSERVKEAGGAAVFANGSPGAAYAHDPDGHGHLFHRVASYGPGREPLLPLPIEGGIDGDRVMTERFLEAILAERPPAYALVWFGEPDTSQHAAPLGSPAHLAALRSADAHVGRVIETVDRLRQKGDDVLLIVGSDHGHQTVKEIIDVEAEVERLGFGAVLASGDLVVVPNGTAALIYASGAARTHLSDLADRLRARPWAGEVVDGASLASIGQTDARGLALYVSMAADDEGTNSFGAPGLSFAAKPLAGKPDRLGNGQHGGLGRYEQSPFLMIEGEGFAAGTHHDPTSLVDIAPTILAHLSVHQEAMSGRALQARRA